MDFQTSFFTYCPNCQSTDFSFKNVTKFQCNACAFEYYHNIAAAVAVVFTFEDKILFTVRNENPDIGMLDLPGGFIDPKETAEEAACREIKEELDLDILPTSLNYITTSPNEYLYKDVPYRTMDLFYECPLTNDKLSIKAKTEIKDLVWIKRNEIDLTKIGFVSIRKVIGEFYLG
ncbi:MAG TPA: NUDIX domain-containing protein [Flavobacterium sp.]|jgi:ADP-ribose pyrophosphatase YjhB (NUDIX family)|uniref:NUDIX hydrolase n=1 Tax=Flavobacterium sp. TaxID=239 RepID=UPI002C97C9BD|nr:NUDIX domain-containing protein [Flavobacterium sp.]MCA0349134.1 NUDIX domain-containing protein [Bacteroidota bacterium]HPW98544.1 NUDIX domain-containing protein [Flavobacterium sp.]HQA74826.1 NUDIX domain-containing protein [Flavobacterium sp.]